MLQRIWLNSIDDVLLLSQRDEDGARKSADLAVLIGWVHPRGTILLVRGIDITCIIFIFLQLDFFASFCPRFLSPKASHIVSLVN